MEEKLNLEGIHLDMTELIEKYNGKIGSVSDPVEIQQISLFCQQNYNDYRKPVLLDMISSQFAYAGLYPHVERVHDITILDHIDLISEKPVTDETRKLFEKMRLNSDLKPYAQNFFWFWDEKVGEEVTDEGRKKLREVIKLMSELGYTPLFSNTDEIRFTKLKDNDKGDND
jgi:DNA polymerase elongation subunit (family B)